MNRDIIRRLMALELSKGSTAEQDEDRTRRLAALRDCCARLREIAADEYAPPQRKAPYSLVADEFTAQQRAAAARMLISKLESDHDWDEATLSTDERKLLEQLFVEMVLEDDGDESHQSIAAPGAA